MQQIFSLDLTANSNYNYSLVIGPEAPKSIVARRGPVRAAGVKIRILLVISKALYSGLAVIHL
jgi:hypothetical protein